MMRDATGALEALRAPDAEDLAAWASWLASRPEKVRAIAEKFPPWKRLWMEKTHQVCLPLSYFEDGTLKVLIEGDRISVPVIVAFEVFGVPPEDLAEWNGKSDAVIIGVKP